MGTLSLHSNTEQQQTRRELRDGSCTIGYPLGKSRTTGHGSVDYFENQDEIQSALNQGCVTTPLQPPIVGEAIIYRQSGPVPMLDTQL